MNAEIVSVGTELLLGQTIDTHAATMARILADCGISCTRRATVGDNLERIVSCLRESLDRADVVVTVGGLGPTVDDITRDAIAGALGDQMIREPAMEEKLRRFFALRKLSWIDSIARQADRPASAEFIDNPNGSAPGLLCRKNGKTVIALPGPKGEFVPMADGPVREFLSTLSGDQVIHSRTLRIVGLGESHVEQQIAPLLDGVNPTVAPYAHPGEVHVRITARAASAGEADRLIDPVEAEIRQRLGNAVFGNDDCTLERAILELAIERRLKLASAESMTGGAIAERLSSVPGASEAFLGGVTTYTVTSKVALLGLESELVAEHGPVSEAVANAMASGIRAKLGADFAVAVTGNAGPTSDVDGKPVGLVFTAIAAPSGTICNEARYRGGREELRKRATQFALTMLRRAIIESS